jgi:hypothetical protein
MSVRAVGAGAVMLERTAPLAFGMLTTALDGHLALR